MKHVLLGVTGSIAAYKAAEIANMLVKKGVDVDVIMTKSAQEFIRTLTFQSLTKHRVYTDVFEEFTPSEIKHISLAKRTDLCLIAPATANIIGKIAHGIADDMLSTVVMALQNKPIYIAPAMNTGMYENPIMQENMLRLKQFGYHFIEPKESLLACGDLGKGALQNPEIIVSTVLSALDLLPKE